MPETTWFLHPLDARTNAIFAEMEGISSEDFLPGMLCSDGSSRNLIECDSHSIVAECNRNKRALSLNYSVFVREGKGQIRLFETPKKAKSTLIGKQPALSHR